MDSHALPRANACSTVVILLESPVTTVEDSGLCAVCAIADHESRAGTTRSDIFLPKLSATETARVKGGGIDARTDLFSLGIIFFLMLTGQKPFTGDTASVMFKIVYEEPPLP